MRSYGLLLAGIVACGAACGAKSQVQGDLTVAGTPVGEVTGPTRVVLAFAQPMIAGGEIGKPLATPPFSVSPALPGIATWTDDKTLVLVPTQSLPVATKYTITVPGATKATDGAVLGKDYAFTFFTEPLTGLPNLVGSDHRAGKLPIVKIDFNHEVAFAQVAEHCAFKAGALVQPARLAPGSAPGPGKTFAVVPAAELGLDTAWSMTCTMGLAGTVGNLGTLAVIEQKFRTYGPLAFVTMEPNGNDIVPDENLKLALAFTNPLAEPYAMKIEPAVVGFPDRCHDLGGDVAGLSCAALLEPLTDYKLTIDATQKDVFGQVLGKSHVLAFHATNANPTISVESGYFVAELTHPQLPVWTRNATEITMTSVPLTQANFHAMKFDWWDTKPMDFAGTGLTPVTKTLSVAGTKNQWSQHPISSADLFGGTPGPGMFYVELGSTEVTREPFVDGGRQKVLVNFTDIGVVSKLSGSRGLVWATHLATGKPFPGATVTVRDSKGKVTFTGSTDAEGIAILPSTKQLEGKSAKVVTDDSEDEGEGGADFRIYVSAGADWTMINPSRSGGLSPWSFNVSYDASETGTRLRGFMHTDRGLYRPGDKVHVKGLARVMRPGEALTAPGAGKKVDVTIEGPQGKTVMTSTAKLSAFGGFWFDLDLPGDARLGDYTLRARMENGTFTRSFSVEEFKPATFEVSGKLATSAIVRRGAIKATVNAAYLYGAPVRTGNVAITVHSRPRTPEFTGYESYAFRDERKVDTSYNWASEAEQTLVAEDHVAIDQAGNAAVNVAIAPADVNSDADLLVRAAVTSPANETISKTFTVPYWKSTRYFGIDSPGWFLDLGKPAKFELASVGPDGKPLDGTAKVTVARRNWNCVWEDWGYRGEYQCKDTSVQVFDKLVTFTGGKSEVEISVDAGGEYLVVLEGEGKNKQDSAPATTSVYAWGEGASWRSSDTMAFDILKDKPTYKAGDTATLILKTDLANATALVTVERDGVLEKRLVDITPKTKTITIPITAAQAPNIYVSVALVQGRTGDGPRGRPRMRMGLVNLPVQPEDNKLTVTVETDKKDYRPGSEVAATVKVTNVKGQPVSAEVSITAADEGVLSLIAYETPDPLPTFYAPWAIGVASATQYEFIRDLPRPNTTRPATGGDAAGSVRSRFVATPVWSPGAVTDANGIATVKFLAPDNLTAYRMMVVAADKGERFGSADKRFTVSKPLQLHAALPRFVRLGDKLLGGVVVHNETGAAGTATVKLVADAHLGVSGPLAQTIQLPKGGRVPVLFALAGAQPGDAKLVFTVSMGAEKDGLQLSLPVSYPSPAVEKSVGFGVSKTDVKLALVLPADALPETAQLVVSVDPDGLSGIEEGLRELIQYPYGCLEQTASKVIPMLAVRDLAEALAIDGLRGPALENFVTAGLAKIGRHQTASGGFSLWLGGEAEAYYTAYALWGLWLAKQEGYRVDASRIDDALNYLRTEANRPDPTRPYYNAHGDAGSQAFALYVRALNGDKDPQAVVRLLATKNLTVFGKALAARALAIDLGPQDAAVQALVAELEQTVADTRPGELVHDRDEDDMYWYMSSSLRTTSIVLGTLVELSPKSTSIPKLVHTLMKHRRTDSYWDTQGNLWALLGLTSYARTVASTSPSVVVSVGGTPLLAATLGGKQRIRSITVPFTAGELTIAPKGEVNYVAKIHYRQQPDRVTAERKGIEVTREYLDEAMQPKQAFTVGDIVVVRVRTKLGDEGEHMITSDPIPAGFEVLNTKFATVGTAGTKQSEGWGTYREIRDDRVDFASEWVPRGDYPHLYSMRAIAVGTFARPPARSSLMYEPSVHGQTAMDTIEIKAK